MKKKKLKKTIKKLRKQLNIFNDSFSKLYVDYKVLESQKEMLIGENKLLHLERDGYLKELQENKKKNSEATSNTTSKSKKSNS